MDAAEAALNLELDRIFRTDTRVPDWLTRLSVSFEMHSLPSARAWEDGKFAIFVFGARKMTDVASCAFIAEADADIDSKPIAERVQAVSKDAEDVHQALLQRSGLEVSNLKEAILKHLCASELRTMHASHWMTAARSRMESFFWAFMFSLNDLSLSYGMQSGQWMRFVVSMCCAFTIIDDAIDEQDDRASNSNTLFSMLPREEATEHAVRLLSAVCDHAFSLDESYAPFFTLNVAVMQALRTDDRHMLDSHGVKNYATAAALAVALNEIRGTQKHVFDVSKFMNELGKPRRVVESCLVC